MVRTGDHIPLPAGYEDIASKIVEAAFLFTKRLGQDCWKMCTRCVSVTS